MIEACVYLGKPHVIDRAAPNLTKAMVVDQLKCDSVWCVRDKKNREKDEWVIYSWDRASIKTIYPCDHAGNALPIQGIPHGMPAAAVALPVPQMRSFTNCLGDPEVREAANYVYNNFLKNKYKNSNRNCFKANGQEIQRPNHGLAHTLRSVFYIPMLASLGRLQISQGDLKKIQVAALFYVSGRESEAAIQTEPDLYKQYRLASGQNYLTYATSKGWNDNDKARFSKAVRNPFGKLSDPANLLIALGHELDMLRCKPKEEYETVLLAEKIAYFYRNKLDQQGQLKKPKIDEPSLQKLKTVALAATKATGDKIFRPGTKRNAHLFIKASTDVNYCIDLLLNLKW